MYSDIQKCTVLYNSVEVWATDYCGSRLVTNHSVVVMVCGSPYEKTKANWKIVEIVTKLLNLLYSTTANDLAKQTWVCNKVWLWISTFVKTHRPKDCPRETLSNYNSLYSQFLVYASTEPCQSWKPLKKNI